MHVHRTFEMEAELNSQMHRFCRMTFRKETH